MTCTVSSPSHSKKFRLHFPPLKARHSSSPLALHTLTLAMSAQQQSPAQQFLNHPVVANAQKTAGAYVNQLDKELTKYPLLNQLEQRTQVPKTVVVLAGGVILVLLIFVNALAHPVSNLVGFALPALASVRAIETPQTGDDTQWLTYWVVFGFFNFLESFALSVVLYYFPFYFAFKTAFVLWLQLPQTRGAQTFYHSVLRPVLANANTKRATPAYSSQQPETAPVS